jgi:hypothetical protein
MKPVKKTMQNTCCALDPRRIAAFAAHNYGRAPEYVRLEMRPLNGGLRNSGVALVRLRFACAPGRPRAFVVKRLTGRDCRELHAYEALLHRSAPDIAPRLLGAERAGPDEVYLYLEWIDTWRDWPWSEVDLAGRVLERLAHLHASLPVERYSAALGNWDYEAHLARSAQTTLELFEACSRRPDLAGVRRSLPAVRRVAAALPAIRRQTLTADPGSAVLHGDVHSGNAKVRQRAGALEPVLLDWSHTRIGSPLEDVSSWLQSLGYWEPEARRRHDSLLGRYLAARGLRATAAKPLREAYWLAGGSNAMAGALRYHVFVATDQESPGWVREESGRQVRDWLRIVRRADAVWKP